MTQADSASVRAVDPPHYRIEAEPLSHFAMAEKTPSKSPQATQWMKGANGGKLQRGNPGNRGGTGRPPSELRAAMRHGLDAALPRLLEVIEEPATPTRDLISAANVLARYRMDERAEEKGGPVQFNVHVVREGVRHPRSTEDELH